MKDEWEGGVMLSNCVLKALPCHLPAHRARSVAPLPSSKNPPPTDPAGRERTTVRARLSGRGSALGVAMRCPTRALPRSSAIVHACSVRKSPPQLRMACHVSSRHAPARARAVIRGRHTRGVGLCIRRGSPPVARYAVRTRPPQTPLWKLALDFCSPLCGDFDCLGRSAWLMKAGERHTIV